MVLAYDFYSLITVFNCCLPDGHIDCLELNEITDSWDKSREACNCPSPECQVSVNHDQKVCKPNAEEACKSSVNTLVEAYRSALEANPPKCNDIWDDYIILQELNANCNNAPSRTPNTPGKSNNF